MDGIEHKHYFSKRKRTDEATIGKSFSSKQVIVEVNAYFPGYCDMTDVYSFDLLVGDMSESYQIEVALLDALQETRPYKWIYDLAIKEFEKRKKERQWGKIICDIMCSQAENNTILSLKEIKGGIAKDIASCIYDICKEGSYSVYEKEHNAYTNCDAYLFEDGPFHVNETVWAEYITAVDYIAKSIYCVAVW